MFLSLRLEVHVHSCVRVYMFKNVFVMYACMCLCTCIYTNGYIYAYIYIYINIYDIHISRFIYSRMYVCFSVYVHTCIHV